MKFIAALSAGICCALYTGLLPDGMVTLAGHSAFSVSMAASIACIAGFAYVLARG